MSQKKVDEYKERKVNREKIYKKEKRILMMEKLVGLAICLVAVVWIGYSVYGQYQRNLQENPETTMINMSAIDDYMSGLSTDDSESSESE
ncbi:MAG TPA: hypothetical protein IAA45_07120 [Candidatus Blautia gallistercoris]|uniref:Uncharacterized protein n=1 Tax=Candidatus Blautia gallistercoris TaxID=2838490 RepID=A0A9D1WHR6_9FIRM|nr:hypothetical protein [Candidatus Blautia gallistercoris]